MVEFIMYHYVRDLKNSNFPNIKGLDYKDFLSQIKFLNQEYNVISIEGFLNGDFKKNDKNCVLTFDDGYIDHYDFVFSALLKEGIKGSFYSPVDTVEENLVLDVNLIHYILASSNEDLILERMSVHYKNFERKESLSQYIKKINTSSRYDTKKTIIIKRLLQTFLPLEVRSKICRLLLEELADINETDLSKSLYMSKDQMREMISNGMHFGSHGKSHFWFESLTIDEQENEIKSSIKFLNSLHSNEYPLTMCYPYGSYNKITLNLLKKYGFKLGLTTKPRTFTLKDSFLEIPRWDTNDYYPKKKKGYLKS